MTQLIAHLKQLAVGDGIEPSPALVVSRIAIAFAVGLILASLIF